jgi:hypothetical protein
MLLRRALPICLAVLTSCDGGRAAGPADDVARTVIAGDYELLASGQTVSTAWPSFPVQFEGIITLGQDPITPKRLFGSFKNLRYFDEYATQQQGIDGVLTGSVDANGSLVLELRGVSREFKWTGRGILVDSRMSGQWESSDPAAGGFTARLLD